MPSSSNNSQIESIRAFYEQALGLMKAGNLEESEKVLRRAVAIYGRDPNILCLLGEVLLKRQQPQEARSWFTLALKHFPGYPRALEGAGKAMLANRKPGKAVTYLTEAAEKLPNRVSTHLALARALALTGKPEEADAALKKALALDPDRALAARAAEAMGQGQLQEAEKMLRDHLVAQPEDPLALRLLSKVALESNRPFPAIRLMKRAVEVAPDFVLARIDLADLYMKQDQFDDALETVEQAIELEPELAHAWVIKGNILSKAQRHEESLAAYDQVLGMVTSHSGALAGKGHVLKTIGRTDEAIATWRECMRTNPTFGEPYWSLANLKTFSFEDEEVKVMEDLANREELADEPRVNMLYALGKHYENQEDYDTAFDRYHRGADLRRPHESYDPVYNQTVTDRVINVFNEEFFAERQGWGDPGNAPILIVGLPRSGSTLIEQILASHSQVEGTMELPDLNHRIREVSRAQEDGKEYPEAVRELSEQDAADLGGRYLEATQRFRTGSPHFIDKLPNNFPHIGFLHLILPNARVINARRHPLDSCLGSFKQLFYKGQSFTYDFFELGQYYLQYQRIMDHWRDVFPGKVLDVEYTDMVRDQEGQTRRILDYLGLPFEEECLRFYETKRAINTASSEQVRQPIYTKGLNFWRHYEPHLEELIYQLEPLLKDLPDEDRPNALK